MSSIQPLKKTQVQPLQPLRVTIPEPEESDQFVQMEEGLSLTARISEITLDSLVESDPFIQMEEAINTTISTNQVAAERIEEHTERLNESLSKSIKKLKNLCVNKDVEKGEEIIDDLRKIELQLKTKSEEEKKEIINKTMQEIFIITQLSTQLIDLINEKTNEKLLLSYFSNKKMYFFISFLCGFGGLTISLMTLDDNKASIKIIIPLMITVSAFNGLCGLLSFINEKTEKENKLLKSFISKLKKTQSKSQEIIRLLKVKDIFKEFTGLSPITLTSSEETTSQTSPKTPNLELNYMLNSNCEEKLSYASDSTRENEDYKEDEEVWTNVLRKRTTDEAENTKPESFSVNSSISQFSDEQLLSINEILTDGVFDALKEIDETLQSNNPE